MYLVRGGTLIAWMFTGDWFCGFVYLTVCCVLLLLVCDVWFLSSAGRFYLILVAIGV